MAAGFVPAYACGNVTWGGWMGKKSRLKRESVRYAEVAPELPGWVIAPLTGAAAPAREEPDEESDADDAPESEGGLTEATLPANARVTGASRARDGAAPGT